MRRRRHKLGGVPKMYDAFVSRSSGQRVFVKSVVGDHVFFQTSQGAHGNMPIASFRKQYARSTS